MGGAQRWIGIAAVCAVAAIAGALGPGACVLDLPIEIACGDGFVDVVAGEECDPAVPDSYVHACAETSRYLGEGRCDPQTCRIDASIDACARCGDGVLDRSVGEECDLDQLGGGVCDSGIGTLRCGPECVYEHVDCEPCGDGRVDHGEECDPQELALIAGPPPEHPCAGANLENLGAKPGGYVSGTYSACNDACQWDRSGCGYCGDGIRDDEIFVDKAKQLRSQAERCDADVIPLALIEEQFASALVYCADLEEGAGLKSGALRPNVACGPECLGLVDYTNVAPCCIVAGMPCTPGDADLRCCYDYATGEDGCEAAGEGLAAHEPQCRRIVRAQ